MGVTYKRALGFHQRGLYAEALKLYKESLKESNNSKGAAAAYIAKQITACEYGVKRKSDPEPVIVTKVGENVNTPNVSNVNAFATPNEQALYLTSSRSEGDAPKGINTSQLDRVCIAKREGRGGKWMVRVIDNGIRYHEGVLGISPDGKDVFVYRGSRDIFMLDISLDFDMQTDLGGKTKYTPLAKRYKLDVDKNYHITSIAITEDRRMIYLSMDDLGEMGGYGGYDLWQSRYDAPTGTWSKLTNLGPMLNTEGDEVSISVLPDGATLFFSSNGHKSMGKFDIYRTEYSDSLANWDKPVNLGHPINTGNDDIYYNPVPNNPNHAYYASERESEPGVYDIYFVNYYGKILNEEEKDRLRLEYLKAVEEAKKANAKEKLKPSETRLLTKKGYDDFPTDSVRVGMKVYLQNIQFANGKATLLSKSYKYLEQLYRLMVYHSTLRVEITGHTDNTGKKSTNQKLSLERAQSVVDYLIGRGIKANRLVARGYGDSQPIAPNKTAAGRALNRRVEFRVISIGDDLVIME
jgi:outer membrane protein OmpA-like peptidoglycan-associated protein